MISLADHTLTYDNVYRAVKSVNLETLKVVLELVYIGLSGNYTTTKEKVITYWLDMSPYALGGWPYLAGRLFGSEEEEALNEAKKHFDGSKVTGMYGTMFIMYTSRCVVKCPYTLSILIGHLCIRLPFTNIIVCIVVKMCRTCQVVARFKFSEWLVGHDNQASIKMPGQLKMHRNLPMTRCYFKHCY